MEAAANFALAQRLAEMSDGELASIVPDRTPVGVWGTSGPGTVDGTQVFVKRVALTDVEAVHPRSTRNHFRLPTYYSYGVGSAGFGVWRELAAHELTGGLDGFPALLHHRVMPRSSPSGELPWSLDDYVRMWNGSAAVGRFIEARNVATHDVWIVLEHVPYELFTWLVLNQERVEDVLGQVFAAIGTLRSLGVVHFDTHFGNVMTDGERCRLGDFGLAMAAGFELTARERAFLARHQHYDYGVPLASMAVMLAMGLGRPLTARELGAWIDGLEELPVVYCPELIAAFRRYRAPMQYMTDFFTRVRRPSKRSTYDDATFAGLLRDAGVPID
ncbi:MAG TPA: hypothetical protein VF230_13185 [Acidimicrobiales bacterium]